jgi:hypothetical protein
VRASRHVRQDHLALGIRVGRSMRHGFSTGLCVRNRAGVLFSWRPQPAFASELEQGCCSVGVLRRCWTQSAILDAHSDPGPGVRPRPSRGASSTGLCVRNRLGASSTGLCVRRCWTQSAILDARSDCGPGCLRSRAGVRPQPAFASETGWVRPKRAFASEDVGRKVPYWRTLRPWPLGCLRSLALCPKPSRGAVQLASSPGLCVRGRAVPGPGCVQPWTLASALESATRRDSPCRCVLSRPSGVFRTKPLVSGYGS